MSVEKSTESDTETLTACAEDVDEMRQETAVKPARDPITGHFLPGNRGGPGRPKGSKDKVSTRLVDLMTDLMDRRGEELLERIADTSPSDALAILTRIVPQAELQRIFLDGDGDKSNQINNIQITLVGKTDDDAALPAPGDRDTLGIEQTPSDKKSQTIQ